MALSIAAQIKGLQGMTLAELRQKWKEVFGEEPRSKHKTFLWRRLAWEIQRQKFGGLSNEATDRIEELRGEFRASPIHTWLDGRQKPRGGQSRQPGIRDPRLPMPGTLLTKQYKNTDVHVMVLEKGFEYQGQVYRSLSAVAREVSGGHWNGYAFFHLNNQYNGNKKTRK